MEEAEEVVTEIEAIVTMHVDEMHDVPGFPGYKTTRDGKVYSEMKPGHLRLMKPNFGAHSAYPTITLRTQNGPKRMLLHRVIALVYWPNPNDNPIVNHRDGNVMNCHADNLEWCTASQNAQHARDTGLTVSSHKGIAV